jgi:hypothetical protein
MITETLAAAPNVRDAEALLVEIYRQRNREAASS